MYKKIISNTLAQIFSKIGTALISIFLLSTLTNYLSLELFWLYNKVYNYLWIFAFLADLWLYTIAIREITANKDATPKIIGNIMTLRWILGIAIIFLSLVIAWGIPWYNSSLELSAIAIVGIFTLVSLFNSSILACMQANMKIEFNLFSTIFWKLSTLFSILCIVFFIFPKQTITDFDIPFIAIIFSGLIGISIHTLLNFYYAQKITKIRFLFDWNYIKHIIKITLPYGVALFLSVVYFKVDIILLSLLEPKDTADVSIALYSLPMKIVEVLMVMWGFYLNSILPSLSEGFSSKKWDQIQKIISLSFRVLFWLWLLTLVLWDIFKEHIIDIIANRDYIDTVDTFSSVDVFPIVILVAFFYFLSSLFNYILIASHQEGKLLKINFIVTIINIIGNIILIPYLSFVGAAIVTVFSQIVLFVMGYFATKKLVDFTYNWKYFFQMMWGAIVLYVIGNWLVAKVSLPYFLEVVLIGGWLTLMFGGYFYIVNRVYLRKYL